MSAKKHTILIVDDEPEILFSLESLLRREFTVHRAESGAAALEVMKKHAIHVIMTDQRMPAMTGVELIDKVHKQYPRAVPIIFTGYADLKAVVDAINTGGLFRYLTKPWDPDELIKVLHDAAAEYDRQVGRDQMLAELRELVDRIKAQDNIEASLREQAVQLGDRLEAWLAQEK